MRLGVDASIAQWKEPRFPKPRVAQVRFLVGALIGVMENGSCEPASLLVHRLSMVDWRNGIAAASKAVQV